MKYEKVFVGQYRNDGYYALCNMVKDELPDAAHTQIIRRRLQGEFADLCTDNYYIAYEDNVCYSRLWTGWGKHKDAIGNFGHFLTLPEKRGQGLGREVIKKWSADIKSRGDAPPRHWDGAPDNGKPQIYPGASSAGGQIFGNAHALRSPRF